MSLTDTANEGIKNAMKAKDEPSLRAYRAIKAALLLAKTDKGDAEIDHDAEIKLLQKLVKQRKESLEIYIKQDRPDLAKPEEEELRIIESFLPKQMSEDDVREIIKGIIAENGISGQQNIGKLMPLAMKALAGKADGKVISTIAKELLG
jgi:uncharacterized protein YqeY